MYIQVETTLGIESSYKTWYRNVIIRPGNDGDISPGCDQKSSKATLNHGATPFQLNLIVFICYLLIYITLNENEKK